MWFDNLINVHSAVQGIVILSLICTLGLALGKIHVKGISLGIAFVFFVVVAVDVGLSIDQNMLEFAESSVFLPCLCMCWVFMWVLTSSGSMRREHIHSISGVWQSSWGTLLSLTSRV